MLILITTIIFGLFAILGVASLPFNGVWMLFVGIIALPIAPPLGLFFIITALIGFSFS